MATLDDQLTDNLVDEQLPKPTRPPTRTAAQRRTGTGLPSGPRGSLPGEDPITATNVDSISNSDPRFNSQEYIDALNSAHPEYSGKPPKAAPLPGLGTYNSGWDPTKLSDPTKGDSYKYKIGRILNDALSRGMAANPETLRALLSEFNGLEAGAWDVAPGRGDKLTYKGKDPYFANLRDNTLDLLRSDNTWWWGFDDVTQGGAPGIVPNPSAGGRPMPRPSGGNSGGGSYGAIGDTSGWTPQQAAASGIGWVDQNNPNYGKQGFVGYNYGSPASTDAGAGSNTGLEALITQMLADQQADRATNASFRNNIRSTITDRVNQAGQPVDENDPIIQSQMRAFRGEQDRSLASGREALAARAAHEGLPTGAFDASLQSSFENAGNEAGGRHADILASRYQDKLNELNSMLALGAGVMDADQAADIQTKIATVRARLDQLNISQQGSIANRELDIRNSLGQQGINLDRTRLGQDDSHFYDALGLSIGREQGSLEAQLLQMLLEGR